MLHHTAYVDYLLFPVFRTQEKKNKSLNTNGLTPISQMRIYLPVDNQSHAVRQHLGCNLLGSGWPDAPEQLVESVCSLHP
jgi:secreted Zn-dependent insulinase-like peptidase